MEETRSYEEIRDLCIEKFRTIYKDSLVFDYCKVDKQTRIRLLEDEKYIKETKAAKASLFIDQLEVLDNVLSGYYANSEKPQDQSGVVLKALEMKNKLLLEDLNVTKDESNALNVTFVAMSREDFEALDTVEINEGGNSVELGSDFGVSEDTDSFEARLKKDVKSRLEKAEE